MAVKSIFAVLVLVAAGSAFAAKEPTRDEKLAALQAALGEFWPKNEAQLEIFSEAKDLASLISVMPDGAPFCGIVNFTEEDKKAYVKDNINVAIKAARISKPPEKYRYFAGVIKILTQILVKDFKALLARGLTQQEEDMFCQNVKEANLANEKLKAVVRMIP